MHSGLPQAVACSLALIVTSGCVQATRHSNTMVFGTNTSFGVKVGTTTGQVPEVLVGYDRQEAVIMPLVANTTSSAAPNMLIPCDLTKAPGSAGSAAYAVHPCSLVAVNGKAMDSYSVLASFGASYDANGSGAKGGLAQYFATGVAAQLLAATGGAAVVATGDAARAAAVKAPAAEETIQSLYGSKAAFQVGVVNGNRFDAFRQRLNAKIALTPEDSLKATVRTFETAAGFSGNISDFCTKRSDCTASVDAYVIEYGINPDKFDAALAAWAVN